MLIAIPLPPDFKLLKLIIFICNIYIKLLTIPEFATEGNKLVRKYFVALLFVTLFTKRTSELDAEVLANVLSDLISAMIFY